MMRDQAPKYFFLEPPLDWKASWSSCSGPRHNQVTLTCRAQVATCGFRWNRTDHRYEVRSDELVKALVAYTRIQILKSIRCRTRRQWIGHARSFKVICISVSRNWERIVAIMYNNVDIISKYEDITSGKLQIRGFQPSHSGLMTVLWETLSNI